MLNWKNKMKQNKVSDLNIELDEIKILPDCPICYENIEDQKIVPCFHKFFLECIQRLEENAVNSKISCPLCRMEIIVTPTVISSNSDPSSIIVPLSSGIILPNLSNNATRNLTGGNS